jgi:hypothetical protein
MPETENKVPTARTDQKAVSARTVSHSDVSATEAARAHQAGMTERMFGDALLRRLRDAKGEIRFRNLEEEWLTSDDGGLVHELRVEVEAAE